MNRRKLLPVLRHIVSRPTAPFHEHAVAEAILGFLKEMPHVKVRSDKYGNMVAHYQRGGPDGRVPEPRHAFAAHMDHPGWVRVKDQTFSTPVDFPGVKHPLQFLGWVPEPWMKKPQVRAYGGFAMWNLPEFQIKDDLIYARACDDLIGCAVIVATFMELEESGAAASCLGLFTRAEEVGLVGAMKLAASGLLPEEITIVSLETSSERPPAKIGDGPILRVGDKTSIFDPAATANLGQIAEDAHIPIQRCLMPGGTCEATAYQIAGFRAAALCVALGNYHNCGPDYKIAPEFVSFSDVQGLVKLCVQTAQDRSKKNHAIKALKKRLKANADKYKKLLKKKL